MAIEDKQIDRHRCILMYDDETVMSAVIALNNETGQDWWHLVLDMDNGKYAAATFASVAGAGKDAGEAFFKQALSELVGSVLIPVDVVADQATAELEPIKQKTASSDSHVAVILNEGEFRGILSVGASRSGAFDEGLVSLAGKYGDIPEEGLLSPRRKKSKSKK